jgi:hypothetical protein
MRVIGKVRLDMAGELGGYRSVSDMPELDPVCIYDILGWIGLSEKRESCKECKSPGGMMEVA